MRYVVMYHEDQELVNALMAGDHLFFVAGSANVPRGLKVRLKNRGYAMQTTDEVMEGNILGQLVRAEPASIRSEANE